ncbi:MAG: hypothetical protein A2W31_05475 [Planctomycetes bacterium RBG_16_64_10]|nr:MAG: hypothetical protein A2W31_05475 [Planctomycetes bacterium RBG_16_64_10]
MENFRWDVTLSPELFDLQPPAGYIDMTGAPAGTNEELAEITAALRTYAETSDGHYPPITRADREHETLATRLREQLGIPVGFESSEAATEHEAYPRYCKAKLGFNAISRIQRDNFHFGYFGESVGPADAGKVLMHWECDVGSYRVIYGDLKSEIVTGTQLRSLLQQDKK